VTDSVGTKIAITEEVTQVAVTNNNSIGVALSDNVTTVSVNNMALPAQFQDAANIAITPYNTITSTNLQVALQQLADQNFRGTSAPTGSTVQEGDTWYDTDDDQLKVYRETSSGTFQWVPIIVGAAGGDSDTVDAGSY
jgi:hypothetical protein|tara:strand:- start:215 stop:628 length:414 start_codon:yes stop_codon:yes gene_type:complete